MLPEFGTLPAPDTMMHFSTEVRDAAHLIGVGVFATADIPPGTIIWVLDRFDRVLRPNTIRTWPSRIREVVERFGYVDANGSVVVCWDAGRLMNHSCNPTSIGIGCAFEVARRPILRGEELTCDYGLLNMTGAFDCVCGAAGCRGRVSPADAPGLLASWDQWARNAFEAARGVDQPLLPFAKVDGADAAIAQALRNGSHIEIPPTRTVVRPLDSRSRDVSDRLWSLS